MTNLPAVIPQPVEPSLVDKAKVVAAHVVSTVRGDKAEIIRLHNLVEMLRKRCSDLSTENDIYVKEISKLKAAKAKTPKTAATRSRTIKTA